MKNLKLNRKISYVKACTSDALWQLKTRTCGLKLGLRFLSAQEAKGLRVACEFARDTYGATGICRFCPCGNICPLWNGTGDAVVLVRNDDPATPVGLDGPTGASAPVKLSRIG